MFSLVHPDQSVTETTLQTLLTQARYTVLYFYPKDNTPGCTTEGIEFTTLHYEFTQLHTQIIGVSKDSVASHCSFISKHGLTPNYLSDPDLLLHKQFNARGTKKLYGKEVTGVLRTTLLLDQTGAVVKQRNSVKVLGHAEKVLLYLQKHLSTTFHKE